MPAPYTRANPFPAKVAVNRSLCGQGSEKDTRHFELDLKGWGLNYDVGDSMTVWPTNDPALVDEIINKIGAKEDETVKGPNGEKALREVLFRDCRITQTTPKFLKAIAERAVNGAPLLTELLKPERKQDLDTYLWGMEIVDFLIEHPSIKWAPQELVDTLAKLLPRMYSISSSLKAHPDRVHFTIDVVHYERRLFDLPGRARGKKSGPGFPKRVQVPTAGRRQHADHHGWPRHRRRAIPCILTGPPSNWRERKKLALLRIAAQTLQLFL